MREYSKNSKGFESNKHSKSDLNYHNFLNFTFLDEFEIKKIIEYYTSPSWAYGPIVTVELR